MIKNIITVLKSTDKINYYTFGAILIFSLLTAAFEMGTVSGFFGALVGLLASALILPILFYLVTVRHTLVALIVAAVLSGAANSIPGTKFLPILLYLSTLQFFAMRKKFYGAYYDVLFQKAMAFAETVPDSTPGFIANSTPGGAKTNVLFNNLVDGSKKNTTVWGAARVNDILVLDNTRDIMYRDRAYFDK
ncbi:MAG: hypothetical protein QM632_05800 [Micrococcaceae bacterium]